MNSKNLTNMSEEIIWQGKPSQWINFPISFWGMVKTATTEIRISNTRITIESGVFSKRTDEVEMHRIKDLTLNQPFLMRLVGVSHITLNTSDKTSPKVVLRGMKKGKELREQLRSAVDTQREKKGVREMDFNEV